MATPTTDQLLTTLEKSRLVPIDVVAELRGRVAKAPGKVDPRSVTKWLVQKKHLTLEQTLDLLAGRTPTRTAVKAPSHQDDDLQLLETSENLEVLGEDDLVPVDEDDLIPVEEAKPKATPKAKSAPKSPASAAAPAKPTKPAARKSESEAPAAPKSAALDDLLSESALTSGPPADQGSLLAMGTSLKGPSTDKKKRRNIKSDSVWDSPLMLWGGGGLLALLIIAGFLYWSIQARMAEDTLAEAEKLFTDGSYTQAIHQFEYYLKTYPNSDPKEIGKAKVHLGLSKMRAIVDSARDWPKALTTCQEVLAEIEKEKEFNEVRADLAILLPKVAEGLAERARLKAKETEVSQDLVNQAEKALTLNNNPDYVPKNVRQEQKLKDVVDSLTLTKRELARDTRLKAALASIQQVVASNKSTEAYGIYKALVKEYPDLYSNPSLQQAVLAVARAEKDQVTFAKTGPKTETTEPASPIEATVTLVNRRAGLVPDVPGRVVFALVEGAAYGLDAVNGRVLWRRFVGFDTQAVPRAIRHASGEDAVMVDSVRKELVCVGATTGELRWRVLLGELCDSHPLVMRDQVAVTTRSGKLVFVDHNTGQTTGVIQVPLKLTVGPSADPRERYLYQLAEHSNLYLLSSETHKCDEVFYLGHEAGSIAVPPFTVSKYLIVAENNGLKTSTLRVLVADDEGKSIKAVQSVGLDGHVHVPPQLTGSSNLLVVTDLGGFYVFDVGKPGKKDPLTQVAMKSATDPTPTIRYFLARGAEFWVADNGFTKYDIQAASARLAPKWIENQKDIFLQPLETFGEYVYHVRRPVGRPGAIVAAVRKADGKAEWETHLAAPLAGAPQVDPDGRNLTAFNLAGGLFSTPAAGVRSAVVDNLANVAVEVPNVARDGFAASLVGGAAAFQIGAPEASSLFVYDPAKGKRVEKLPLPFQPASPPLAFKGNLLIGSQTGPVMLLDAAGQNAAEPFLPPAEGGAIFAWRLPCLVGADEVLIADGATKVYRLGLRAQPRPHLAALATADMIKPIVSPAAALNDMAYLVDADNRVIALPLPSLSDHRDWNLKARLSWGPARVGDRVYLTSADGKLHCFDGKPEPVWSIPLAHGPVAGLPLESDGKLIVASASGMVYALDEQGKELAKIETGLPLANGPLRLADKLLLIGHDGALHLTAMP